MPKRIIYVKRNLMEQNKDIELLLSRLFANEELTSDEKLFIDEWFSMSEENRYYYNELRLIWRNANPAFPRDEIDVEKAKQRVLQTIRKRRSKINVVVHIFRTVAAILFIPLLLTLGYMYSATDKEENEQVVYNEVFADSFTRSAVILPDGSKIWLNSKSSLIYPLKFKDSRREVELKGEGYFEVHADKNSPFIVTCNSQKIVATGTKFSVQAYNQENMIVSLGEGVVTVKRPDDSNLAQLKPNQTLKYNSIQDASVVITEDVYKRYAWKDAKIVFRNDPLDEVMERLSRIYNVRIIISDPEIKKYTLRATFEDETINDILFLIKATSPIMYKELPRSIDEKTGNINQKTFVISKRK